jgi:hypothetical protein
VVLRRRDARDDADDYGYRFSLCGGSGAIGVPNSGLQGSTGSVTHTVFTMGLLVIVAFEIVSSSSSTETYGFSLHRRLSVRTNLVADALTYWYEFCLDGIANRWNPVRRPPGVGAWCAELTRPRLGLSRSLGL